MKSRSAAWTLAAAFGVAVGSAVHIAHLSINDHQSEAFFLAAVLAVVIAAAFAVWVTLDESAARREVRQREDRHNLTAHTEEVVERAVERVAERVESHVERVARLLAVTEQTVTLPALSRTVHTTTYAPMQELDVNQSAMYLEMLERTGDVSEYRKNGSSR